MSLYLLTALVRSGRSLRTVSPKVKVARRPGKPSRVLMGIRERIDSRAANSDGRWTIGSCRGRKPRLVDTMNAGSVVSSGLVSRSTSKAGLVAVEPMVEEGLCEESGRGRGLV